MADAVLASMDDGEVRLLRSPDGKLTLSVAYDAENAFGHRVTAAELHGLASAAGVSPQRALDQAALRQWAMSVRARGEAAWADRIEWQAALLPGCCDEWPECAHMLAVEPPPPCTRLEAPSRERLLDAARRAASRDGRQFGARDVATVDAILGALGR